MSRKILDVDVLRPLLCDFAGAPESPDYSPGLAFPSVNPTVITGPSDSQGYCLGQTDTGHVRAFVVKDPTPSLSEKFIGTQRCTNSKITTLRNMKCILSVCD